MTAGRSGGAPCVLTPAEVREPGRLRGPGPGAWEGGLSRVIPPGSALCVSHVGELRLPFRVRDPSGVTGLAGSELSANAKISTTDAHSHAGLVGYSAAIVTTI